MSKFVVKALRKGRGWEQYEHHTPEVIREKYIELGKHGDVIKRIIEVDGEEIDDAMLVEVSGVTQKSP